MRVLLRGVEVGAINVVHGGTCEFRFNHGYLERAPRPVLSQSFEETSLAQPAVGSGGKLPVFFSNLLPEETGALHKLLKDQIGFNSEFELLAIVGRDLPGAVTVEGGATTSTLAQQVAAVDPQVASNQRLRFSLAGVMPKFPARLAFPGDRVAIPISGQGAEWILKPPVSGYPALPNVEFATMEWARAAGLAVPQTRLVRIADVDDLPLEYDSGAQAYMVQRFDRSPQGPIHAEDFAQVYAMAPEDRYDLTTEDLCSGVFAICGWPGLEEFIRRLVFFCVCGNGDAHAKNWSITYPDGINADLSPLYDAVSTVVYPSLCGPGSGMALSLGGSTPWSAFSRASLRGLSALCDDPSRFERFVDESVQRAFDTNHVGLGHIAGDRQKTRLVQHMNDAHQRLAP